MAGLPNRAHPNTLHSLEWLLQIGYQCATLTLQINESSASQYHIDATSDVEFAQQLSTHHMNNSVPSYVFKPSDKSYDDSFVLR
ncbi:hypothetical protein WMY93_032455, partial [Mugilogobius chulae]